MATGGLAVPTSCAAKFAFVGETEIADWVAIPASGIVCGLPAASSEIIIEADRFPAAAGSKATLTMQLVAVPRSEEQLLDSVKSAGLTPARLI